MRERERERERLLCNLFPFVDISYQLCLSILFGLVLSLCDYLNSRFYAGYRYNVGIIDIVVCRC